MKKILLAGTLLFAMGATAFAQNEVYGRSVRLGFKLDPVFSNTLKPFDNGVEKDGGKFGFNYGLMADILFSDGRGAFATGVEVDHTGGSLKTTEEGIGRYGAGTYDLKLQYLKIPLTVKLKTNPVNGFRWWGQFGSYLDAMIGARMDYEAAEGSGSNERVMKDLNKVNMGLMLGAGGEYNLGYKTDLYFGIGFENGFTDVTSNKKWNDGKVALNRWALRLGVFF
ncbi:hypothetical protein GCM10027051_10030 [Niabella terrae]